MSETPDIQTHIEIASNFQLVCQNFVEWVKSVSLKKEQVISISASETSTENADAVLTLVYKATEEPGMTSLDGLKFELQKNIVDWDDQYAILS